jgi:hypothetical protein
MHQLGVGIGMVTIERVKDAGNGGRRLHRSAG